MTDFEPISGRARKMPARELRSLLGLARGFDAGLADPALLVGLETADDGAVYRLDEDLAIVLSSDCSGPVLDDPFDWGRVAATDALSDIYAMGGTPFLALNLVSWPTDRLPIELLAHVIDGAASVARDAGVVVAGGHTLASPEATFGMAVCGRVHPRSVLSNATARPGNALVLTKPLGLGTIAAGMRQGLAEPEVARAALELMTRLNSDAKDAALEIGVEAATDVSGFGLLGHLHEMLVASGLAALVDPSRVPVIPGARELLARGVAPQDAVDNHEFVGPLVEWAGLPHEAQILLADPQPSGGLLLAVDPARSGTLLTALRARGVTDAAVIGHTIEGPPGHVGLH